MDSPRNIEVPDHWLVDTGVTTYWPHKEGIWINKETEPILRLAAIYHGLIDIPEALDQLAKCSNQFLDEYAEELLQFLKPAMDKARTGGEITTIGAPLQTEAEAEKAAAIYEPWVDDWALGNKKMLEWVIGINTTETILDLLPFNRNERRRLVDRITEFSSQFSPPWVWKTLCSGEYRRLDQAKRELARCTVQSKGFYRKRERELLTHARYWIAIRILKIPPRKWLNELVTRSSKKDFRLTENDLTDKILKPFDLAFEYERKPGRPQSADNTSRADSKVR
jgi:hypothetical protein